jgi:NCAIR mutase (PurE)-related protein
MRNDKTGVPERLVEASKSESEIQQEIIKIQEKMIEKQVGIIKLQREIEEALKQENRQLNDHLRMITGQVK